VLRASDDDRWIFDDNRQRIEVHGRFRSENAAVRNAAVASGLGIGLAPLWQVRRLIEQGAVRVNGDVHGELEIRREGLDQAVLQAGKRRFARISL
jgi:DNA-binding transcriptional LysR family regulator